MCWFLYCWGPWITHAWVWCFKQFQFISFSCKHPVERCSKFSCRDWTKKWLAICFFPMLLYVFPWITERGSSLGGAMVLLVPLLMTSLTDVGHYDFSDNWTIEQWLLPCVLKGVSRVLVFSLCWENWIELHCDYCLLHLLQQEKAGGKVSFVLFYCWDAKVG